MKAPAHSGPTQIIGSSRGTKPGVRMRKGDEMLCPAAWTSKSNPLYLIRTILNNDIRRALEVRRLQLRITSLQTFERYGISGWTIRCVKGICGKIRLRWHEIQTLRDAILIGLGKSVPLCGASSSHNRRLVNRYHVGVRASRQDTGILTGREQEACRHKKSRLHETSQIGPCRRLEYFKEP